ncbi:hypothetical protein DWH39_17345 [Escherichia coli]|nr:hypothetical protein [Escherichia coli]EFO1446407.1 hypothetical protein [Escherichia coli]
MDDSHKKHHNLKPAQAGFLLSALNILLKYKKYLLLIKSIRLQLLDLSGILCCNEGRSKGHLFVLLKNCVLTLGCSLGRNI